MLKTTLNGNLVEGSICFEKAYFWVQYECRWPKIVFSTSFLFLVNVQLQNKRENENSRENENENKKILSMFNYGF